VQKQIADIYRRRDDHVDGLKKQLKYAE